MGSEMHWNMRAHAMDSLKVADIVDMLREEPFSGDLSAEQIRALADCAHARSLDPREYLWRQGQQSVALYLIQSGHVALEISVPGQGPLCIDIVHEGEILGYSSLMGSSRNQFDARALTPVSCIAVEWERLHRLMERDQKLGYALLKRMAPMMARKLESAQLRLLDVNGLERLRTAG
jgi:CRP/FNR family cyclic AMP-dependent transcriptional regulator